MNDKGLCSGDVVIYADRQGHHIALALKVNDKKSHFLFVTSNPYWNLRARKLTKEEEILLGYPSRGNLSYFAPVIRPNEFAVITGKSYPLHRIQDLIIEFGI